MNTSSYVKLCVLTTGLSLAFVSILPAADRSSSNQRPTAVIPVRFAISERKIDLKPVDRNSSRSEALNPNRNGEIFDSLGRLIEIKTASLHSVYTYHRDGYSVFSENKARGVNTVSEYKNGKLFSVQHSTGEYLRYGADGRSLDLMITADGNIHEYSTQKNKDGSVYKRVTTVNGKYASTHTYLGPSTVIVEYANGSVQKTVNGLLIYSKDRSGAEWTYTYTWDKKGALESRTATRLSDGFTQVLDYKKPRYSNGNNSPVNFQKVLKAALTTGKTGETLTVQTSEKNTYKLNDGRLQAMTRQAKSEHLFNGNRVLDQAKYYNGTVITLGADGRYVRVVQERPTGSVRR